MKKNLTKEMAYAAGQDTGNRNMKKAMRKVWNQEDWNVASEITNRLLDTLELALNSKWCI